jgi:hypothetical protein
MPLYSTKHSRKKQQNVAGKFGGARIFERRTRTILRNFTRLQTPDGIRARLTTTPNNFV